jgi:hypothetical protein
LRISAFLPPEAADWIRRKRNGFQVERRIGSDPPDRS